MADDLTRAARTERAFTDYFAERAAHADFPPLDPAALTSRPEKRTFPAWAAALAAVAASLVLVAVLVPLGGGRLISDPVPATPEGPGGPGTWQKTSPIPIGQRYAAVSMWAGGSFYVLGGNSHCGLDDQGRPLPEATCRASLPSLGSHLADGARYDPATDTWTRIADAPLLIGAGQGVVIGDALYVLPEEADAQQPAVRPVLRYEPSTDTWNTLPLPSGERIDQLLGWGGKLYASTMAVGCIDDDCRGVQQWVAGDSQWRTLGLETTPLRFLQGSLAAVSDGFVALLGATDGTVASATAFRDGRWMDLPTPPFAYATWLGAVGDRVIAVTSDEDAYVLDLADPQWRRLPASSGIGGLVGADGAFAARFSDGIHVALGGQLYDPVAGTWTEVPRLPYPDWMFGSFASSGGQLLGCYVGPESSLNDCYLLRLGSPTPAASPVPADSWVTTAKTPLTPRTDALTAWAGGEFFILGGQPCTGQAATGACIPQAAATDAAAYNPSTDTWRSITAPPFPVDSSDSVTVLDQTLYVISVAADAFWSYDTAQDRWTNLPVPPTGTHGGTAATQLVATGETLLALGEQHQPDSWFDPKTGAWTELPAGTYPNGVYPGEARRAVAFTGKELLIGEPDVSGDDDIVRFTVFDPDDDGRLFTRPSDLDPGTFHGRALPVVTQSATTVMVPWDEDGAAAYRTGGGQEWIPIPEPTRSGGPLTPGLVAGRLVSFRGNLFDPESGSWRYPAALPDGDSGAALQVGGPDGVLSCFSLQDPHGLGEACYLFHG